MKNRTRHQFRTGAPDTHTPEAPSPTPPPHTSSPVGVYGLTVRDVPYKGQIETRGMRSTSLRLRISDDPSGLGGGPPGPDQEFKGPDHGGLYPSHWSGRDGGRETLPLPQARKGLGTGELYSSHWSRKGVVGGRLYLSHRSGGDGGQETLPLPQVPERRVAP